MTKLHIAFATVAALVLAGCVVAEGPAKSPARSGAAQSANGDAKDEPVNEVESVAVRVLESFPEQLHINARGQANSVASDARLRPRGVRDGVHEFDFIARLPRGPVTMMMGPITAHHSMTRPPGLRGIRVYARNNSVTERVK